MKRYHNLYKNICNLNNIKLSYNEVCFNTKNKRRVSRLRDYRSIYITQVYHILISKSYVVDSYNKFIIYEPKKRNIVSQNLIDKIINHLVARFILYPALLPCLIDSNVASRKNMGTHKGLIYSSDFRNKSNIKYKSYYILKCDINKFFASIDHDILKAKILRRIKDKDALKIIFDIIDSNDEGLYIGLMTSQILAIYFLNDLDHFIKENLKIRYYVRYQDDFLLYHPSKAYLKYCLHQIELFLKGEKLELNKKTRIFKNTNHFLFLGRNTNIQYARYRNVKRKLKSRLYQYHSKKISLTSFSSSLICYRKLCNRNIILKNDISK